MVPCAKKTESKEKRIRSTRRKQYYRGLTAKWIVLSYNLYIQLSNSSANLLNVTPNTEKKFIKTDTNFHQTFVFLTDRSPKSESQCETERKTFFFFCLQSERPMGLWVSILSWRRTRPALYRLKLPELDLYRLRDISDDPRDLTFVQKGLSHTRRVL